jgi:hypothetical protein
LRSERLASMSQFASCLRTISEILWPASGRRWNHGGGRARRIRCRWCEDLHFTVERLQGMINDMLDVYQNYSVCRSLPLRCVSMTCP